MSKQDILKIDQIKLKLEAKAIVNFNRIFKNIAKDVENIYKSKGYVNSNEIAKNYYPEFLKEIRDTMRKTIKTFGFDSRKLLELKFNLFFDAEFKKQFLDFEYKKVKIIDENLDPKLENINNEFLKEATFFIANQSEEQANYITDTNAKEIDLAIKQETEKQDNILTEVLAINIAINLLKRKQARSELIASQVVGVSEAWARQTENQIIVNANLQTSKKPNQLDKPSNLQTPIKPNLNNELELTKPLKQIKTWWAILDTKTRTTHAQADQQQVEVNDYFNVGGQQAKYPRDPNLSASESINCRCVANYSFE